jgi:hypothetical protein
MERHFVQSGPDLLMQQTPLAFEVRERRRHEDSDLIGHFARPAT